MEGWNSEYRGVNRQILCSDSESFSSQKPCGLFPNGVQGLCDINFCFVLSLSCCAFRKPVPTLVARSLSPCGFRIATSYLEARTDKARGRGEVR